MPVKKLLNIKDSFEASFEKAPYGIIVITAKGEIETTNPFIEQFLGYNKSELMGQQVEDLVAEELRGEYAQFRERYMSDPELRAKSVGMELSARHKNGSLLPVEVSLAYFQPSEKEATVFVYIKDIGKRKKAENELRASEQMLRLFIENTPAAVAIFDKNMKYIITSKRWLTDYRLGDRDIIGLSHYEVFPNLPQEFIDFHRRGLAGENFRNREDPFVREDGSVQWVRWEITPWRTAAGEIGGIIFFSEVFTERRNAEDAVRKSEERFRLFFEGIKDSFIVTEAVKDTAGNIIDLRYVDMNAAGEQLLGKPKKELIGHLRSEIYETFDPEARNMTNRVILNNELVMQERFMPLTKRWYEITSYSPVPDQMATLGVDITEKKEKDEKLRNARIELEKRFNRLRVLNGELRDFAFVSSHHLQEPLRKLQTFATLIKSTQGTNLDATGRDFLDRLLREATVARERVQDFLLFTNLNIKNRIKIPVSLNDVVKSVLEELTAKIEETHARVEILNELPCIHADPGMMRSVFYHLITNAMKFHRPNVPPVIKIFSENIPNNAEQTEIHIQDNGVGIDNKYVKQLFNLFKRLSNGESGTGVGLAVSRKICALHHGDLRVESTLGVGSTFTLTLPFGNGENENSSFVQQKTGKL